MPDLFNENLDAENYTQLATMLECLVKEHRDIDEKITMLTQENAGKTNIDIQRLKKHKLELKDKIEILKSLLLPNVIA